ncbi:MAG: hypothetical protein ACOH2V_10210 [Candidatus Saccharimonadaceae bacterium]
MFSLNEGNRYVVCLQGVDLRKGLNGLTLPKYDVFIFADYNISRIISEPYS